MQLSVQQCSYFSNNGLKLIGYRTQLAGRQAEMFQLASEIIHGRRKQNSLAYFLNDVISAYLCKKAAKRLALTNYLEVILRNK